MRRPKKKRQDAKIAKIAKIFIFVMVGLALVFSSCRRSVETAPPPAGLTVMANAAKGGVNSQMAQWLEEELPEVSRELGAPVTFLSAGLNDQDYKARVALDIKGGRGADVMDVDQFWVPEFAKADFIMPLDQYFQAWPAHSQFYPPIQKMGTFQGRLYQVVWNADLRMIFYNRDLFAKAGIALPWQPESWEDIIAAAKRLKEKLPGVTPLQIDAGTVMDEATTMQGFFMVFLGAQGKLYDESRDGWIVDSPALRRALAFYRRIYQEERLADPDLQIAPKAREKSFDLFRQEKIAVYVESTWFYTSVLDPKNPSWGFADRDRKIGWAKMPGGGNPGDPPFVSISGGDGLIVNPHSANPELAWKLVTLLNDRDRQARLFMKKPFTPTRQDLAQVPAVKAQDFISQVAAAIMPYTSFRPALPEYPEISFHLQYLTERVITGQLSVDEAIAEFGKAVENVVGEKRVGREK